jgi:hypothetical protein
MSPILYWTLLILTRGYALYRGGHHERLVAAICIVATIVTVTVNSPVNRMYANVESGALLVDLAVLAAFVAVALVSDRFWPLWVAGLQLTTSIAHFLKAVDPQLVPLAYGAAVRFWSYPILIILFFGAWRNHRRHQPHDRARTAY